MSKRYSELLRYALMFLSAGSIALAQQGGADACSAVTSYGEVQKFAAPDAAAPAAAPTPGGRGGGGRGGNAGKAGDATPYVKFAPGHANGPSPSLEYVKIPSAPMLPYKAVESLAAPAGTKWGNIGAVGLLSNGHLIVYNRMPQYTMVEYDTQGRFVRSFNENIAGRPHGMRIDKNDNIWITDVLCHTVRKLSPTGEVLLTLGTKGKAGVWDEAKGDHLLNQPTDLAIAPNGDIFVSSGHGNPEPRVIRFDKNGRYITSWSMKPTDGTGASTVHSIMVDKDNNVWVAERDMGKIHIFDVNGKRQRVIQMDNFVCGFYTDPKGQLWITTGFDGMMMHIDSNGKVLGWFGKAGTAPLEFGEAHFMAMSADMKTIYVADSYSAKLHKFAMTN